MKIEVEKITKDAARELLATSLGNRPIKANSLAKLEAHLRNGTWENSLTDILIDEGGHLIGGHHQLTAIYNTGITAECVVRRGVPSRVKAMTNVCKESSPNDAWLLSGHSPIPNAETSWAALKFALVVKQSIAKGVNVIDRKDSVLFTNECLVESMESLHEKLSMAVTTARKMVRSICGATDKNKVRVGSVAPVAGAIFVLGRSCENFVRDIMSGTIIAGSPIEYFRAFIRNTVKDSSYVRGIGFLFAFYDTVHGCKRGMLYIPSRLLLESNVEKAIEVVKEAHE